jgi:cellulose synthase operon protein C
MGRRLPAIALFFAFACDAPPADPQAALYRRAYDLTVAGKEAEARALYLQIVGPDGGAPPGIDTRATVASAHVALAEHDFQNGDFDSAVEHYRAAAANPRAKVRPYALYKQGWCYLNTGDAVQAMQAFERVIGLRSDPTIAERQRSDLVNEGSKGLVQAYALGGATEDAAAYFQKAVGDRAPELLERLAVLYREQGKWAQSLATFRELIASHVDSPRICMWQEGVVLASLGIPRRPRLPEKDQLAEVERLEAVLSRMEKMKAVSPADLQTCRARVHDIMKELALVWHKGAQKTKDADAYRLTDPLYRQYLARFPDDKSAVDMTFHHAELLWSMGRWADAAEEYHRVIELDPRGKLVKEAADAMLLATRNAVESEGKPSRVNPGASARTLQPFTDKEKKLLDAFQFYVEAVPSAPELVQVKYRQARMYYEHNHFERAVELFAALAGQYPDSELAIYSANLQLDSLDALGRTADRCVAARKLVAGPLAAREREAARSWKRIVADCARAQR